MVGYKDKNIFKTKEKQEDGSMSAVDKIIGIEEEGTLRFGDHTLQKKEKVVDFPYQGDLLKVKTCYEATRLEKNGLFLYESIPGTTVKQFSEIEEGIEFTVEGDQDIQITLGLAEQTHYKVATNEEIIGEMVTNLSGKLSISVKTSSFGMATVEVKKV